MSTTEVLELTPLQSSPLAGASPQARHAIPRQHTPTHFNFALRDLSFFLLGLVFLWAIPNPI